MCLTRLYEQRLLVAAFGRVCLGVSDDRGIAKALGMWKPWEFLGV